MTAKPLAHEDVDSNPLPESGKFLQFLAILRRLGNFLEKPIGVYGQKLDSPPPNWKISIWGGWGVVSDRNALAQANRKIGF
jgi:hypothetical protein